MACSAECTEPIESVSPGRRGISYHYPGCASRWRRISRMSTALVVQFRCLSPISPSAPIAGRRRQSYAVSGSVGQQRALPSPGSWSRRSSHTRATIYGHVFLCFRLFVAQRLHGAELRGVNRCLLLGAAGAAGTGAPGVSCVHWRTAARGRSFKRGGKRGQEVGRELKEGEEGRLTCHRTGTSRSSSRSSRPGRRGWGRWSAG